MIKRIWFNDEGQDLTHLDIANGQVVGGGLPFTASIFVGRRLRKKYRLTVGGLLHFTDGYIRYAITRIEEVDEMAAAVAAKKRRTSDAANHH